MPRVSSLYHPPSRLPALVARQIRISSASRCDMPGVAPQHHHLVRRGVVISRIQTQMLRPFPVRTRSHHRTVINQLSEHRAIIDVRRCHQDAERNTSAINQNVVFHSRFSAICRVRAAFFFPPQVSARKCHHLIATPTRLNASHRRGADSWHGCVQRLRPVSILQSGHRRFATRRTLWARHARGNPPTAHKGWHPESAGHLCAGVRHARAEAVEEAAVRSLPIVGQELGGVFSCTHFTKLFRFADTLLGRYSRLGDYLSDNIKRSSPGTGSGNSGKD
jgi:hypothetical protein